MDKKAVLKMLCGFNITRINVDFEGAGDSGQIEHINYTQANGLDRDAIDALPIPDEVKAACEIEPNEKKTVSALVEELVYAALEANGNDWYNNDGGYGEVIIIPADGKVEVDMQIRYTTTEAFPSDFSLDPEEVDWTEKVDG